MRKNDGFIRVFAGFSNSQERRLKNGRVFLFYDPLKKAFEMCISIPETGAKYLT